MTAIAGCVNFSRFPEVNHTAARAVSPFRHRAVRVWLRPDNLRGGISNNRDPGTHRDSLASHDNRGNFDPDNLVQRKSPTAPKS